MTPVDNALLPQVFEKYARNGPYHWDHVSGSLDKHNIFTQARYDLALKKLSEKLDRLNGKQILDVGCGDGAFAYLLMQAGARVVGLEYDSLALTFAKQELSRRKTRPRLIQGSAYTLPFANQAFDAVVATEVIEHLHDRKIGVAEMARVTKFGGIVMITTPSRLTEFPTDPFHCHEYFPAELKAELERYLKDVGVSQVQPAAVAEIFWHYRKYRLFRWGVNALDLVFGINPLKWQCQPFRYYLMLLATGARQELSR